MRKTFTGTIVSALVLAGLTLGQIAPARAAKTVVLRYHFAQGQRVAYVITGSTSSVSAAGVSDILGLKERLSFSLKVLKVFSDGSANVRTDFGAGTLTYNGQDTALPLKGVYQIEHLAPDGHVLASKTYGVAEGSSLGKIDISSSSTPPLPSGPVGVGSTWTSIQRISLGNFGTVTGTQHLRLLSFGSQHGRTTAVIRATSTGPVSLNISGITLSGTAITSTDTTIYAGDGTLVSVHGSVKINGTLDTGSGSGSGGADLALVEKLDIVQG